MPISPPVSIIIPNFNGALLLEKNLPSVLLALDAYYGGGRVIVVDDGSVDNSIGVLSEQFPHVQVIQHPENLGFAEAIHSGVRAADTQALIFLNSDVQPEPGFIDPLMQKLCEEGVFSVQSAIREESGSIHPYCLFRFRFRRGSLKRLKTPNLGTRPWLCLYASGGSMAVDKGKFEELGGFLAVFKPFYWEDFDLGVRAWRRGWQTWLVPASEVLHQKHGSIRDNVKRKRVRRALQGNKLVAEWIHFPVKTMAVWLLPRLVIRTLARTLTGDVGYWQALGDAIRRIPEVLAIRRDIKASARQDFLEVLRLIEEENNGHGIEVL
jgi:GT2 family glycosyltransferase